jgi:predicted patatin/cPLA2 family phospholipase
MRAGFVAGAVMALMDKGFTQFERAVAVSASVPTLAYMASGQRQEMEKIWREELNTPKLVCYSCIPATSLALSTRRPLLNIDYLVHDVFKSKFPLNVPALLKSSMTCRFAATLVPEGRLVFLSPQDDDIYKICKAAVAVPGCYPGTVIINECEFVDGGTVNPLPADCLFETKAEKVLVVLSKPLGNEAEPPNLLERSLFWRYFNKYDWMMEKLHESAASYTEEVEFMQQLADETPPQAFIISPDTMPPAGLITRDRRKINRSINQGYRKVEALEKEINAFLNGAG